MASDVVEWDGRGDLATATLLATTTDDAAAWPDVLADEYDGDDLVEVICRDGGREMTDIEEIRVHRSYLDARAERYLDALLMRPDSMEAGDVEFGIVDSLAGDKLRVVQ